jgi:apolipoprotein N-acyltransferase
MLGNIMKNTKPLYLLILGAILIASTHMRFGFGFLIFIEAIPFLIYLERSQTLRSQILLFAFLFLGWSLAIAKIVTDPLPWFITFGFSLPISFFKYLPFLGYLLFKDSKYSEWLFPAMLVIGEWLQASFSPFASWGSVAYTQINNPIWLQIVSVGGIWMLSYSIYFIVYQIYLLIGQGYTHCKSSK